MSRSFFVKRKGFNYMTKSKAEKIANIDEQIAQLENQRKRLIQLQREQDRKDRTRRLIERGAMLESMIDGATALDNGQIKAFLEMTIRTDYARRMLANLTAVPKETATLDSTETALQGDPPSATR